MHGRYDAKDVAPKVRKLRVQTQRGREDVAGTMTYTIIIDSTTAYLLMFTISIVFR